MFEIQRKTTFATPRAHTLRKYNLNALNHYEHKTILYHAGLCFKTGLETETTQTRAIRRMAERGVRSALRGKKGNPKFLNFI